MPEVIEAVRALPARGLVLDGEAIALRPDGRPWPFQVTSSRVARRVPNGPGEPARLSTLFFDALHADGRDLLDEPAQRRREVLDGLAPTDLLIPRHRVDLDDDDARAARAQEIAEQALAAGHEGVLVKSLEAPYAMGRRGAAWVKVKPRITLDLVVLAAERGHGRRTGRLSNLHLGARDPDGAYGPAGGFVMLGKTFKGLSDAMLDWQTEYLNGLAIADDGYVVTVRPELVVEVAFDGVQTSPRYPAGMALRFARVLAHRPDKVAQEADTVSAVRRHHQGPTDERQGRDPAG
jgi:DNA ligase-1